MADVSSFTGFSESAVKFFLDLRENNDKIWFADHKADFEQNVMNPARDFVMAMGDRLRTISPEVEAIPKTDKSIFRIYRDIRFSKDKRPFKTHLGVFFWEGPRKKMESSGFYFHLEPPNLMLGVGMYMFPRDLLQPYREAVVHPVHGEKLKAAIRKVRDEFAYNIGGKHYKRIPSGFDPEHENAEFLLYNGLHVGEEINIPDALFSVELIDFCYERFKKMAPLHKWLVEFSKRTG